MSVAIFAALLLASLLLILSLAQERIVFQPPKFFPEPPPDSAKRIEYHAADGQRLIAFFIESQTPGAGALICFHGNADLALWQIDWGRQVAKRTGHSVFLAEYRGYYGLDGHPTYRHSALDADAAYLAARTETRLDANKFSFFGHSLGSAVAAELALRYRARRLLLQAPFTSARAMGRLIIGRPLLTLWSRLSRVHYDNVAAVSKTDALVSVSHGARDRIVPIRMGREVYSSAKVKGALLVVDSAGHNDLPEKGGEGYWQWIAAALA
jgi:uncharacterized protein